MDPSHRTLRGRGTPINPRPRFQTLEIEPEELSGGDPEDESADPRTLYLVDSTRTVLSRNDSPDIGFDVSLNPYRGCEHGCAYCYARPTHEYLDLSAGLDFETRILVKREAPSLLRAELGRRSWRPRVIAFSGVTDCYQPVERALRITRGCLEVLAELRNPASLITKSRLVTRDADVLSDLAAHRCASVTLSVTTLDADLARVLEPRAAQPRARLAAIRDLSRAGIPVGVNVAPIVPGLTDHEVPAILRAAAEAGARWAGYVMLRLPYGVKGLFEDWLERHRPERRKRVLHRIADVRGGALYDSRWGVRQRGTGLIARQIRELFELSRERAGLGARGPELSTAHFRARRPGQLELFEGALRG
ncbi:MAG: PA0069 family radical SAM protein [Proteobacteria bacterium]|nr:PA0069 family radical SAM protein [Pseudomonadota bacterium]